MKQIILATVFFISAFAFAQSDGSITGILLDGESSNEALMLAKVSIKETGAEVLSDENGVFKFQNLKDGTYTLISSFVGYETNESEIKVVSNKPVNIKLFLQARTISLEDLVFAIASADKKETASSL
ncbi:CarboxypepD_reg-like domain-containing protein [Flaviramulus basaltis]|uniref:CarboxypepD_reg-like domain-containing protein n=1 Tax=Flaviramulus basaltis TaxID=369401 RepID=A0A1K2IEA8_9FLAO|nr:carboxypeptidase-like regulatory domain-containing protein [Flaviramulus basaltis]SFZ90624.1 CarboxypepD_reg-like domain-containing protein [Flaviramulus basaltis]